jgi:hypothetical protein
MLLSMGLGDSILLTKPNGNLALQPGPTIANAIPDPDASRLRDRAVICPSGTPSQNFRRRPILLLRCSW